MLWSSTSDLAGRPRPSPSPDPSGWYSTTWTRCGTRPVAEASRSSLGVSTTLMGNARVHRRGRLAGNLGHHPAGDCGVGNGVSSNSPLTLKLRPLAPLPTEDVGGERLPTSWVGPRPHPRRLRRRVAAAPRGHRTTGRARAGSCIARADAEPAVAHPERGDREHADREREHEERRDARDDLRARAREVDLRVGLLRTLMGAVRGRRRSVRSASRSPSFFRQRSVMRRPPRPGARAGAGGRASDAPSRPRTTSR